MAKRGKTFSVFFFRGLTSFSPSPSPSPSLSVSLHFTTDRYFSFIRFFCGAADAMSEKKGKGGSGGGSGAGSLGGLLSLSTEIIGLLSNASSVRELCRKDGSSYQEEGRNPYHRTHLTTG